LRGENIAQEFQVIVESYIEKRFGTQTVAEVA
jgi:(E)-4-hydroxy-3-methylbut-2-enyl-diphosphate synthase